MAAIATPPTQAMVNQGSDTPVIFIAVSAPIAAGVITDMEKPDKNAAGTSNAIPVEAAKAYCDQNGLSYKEATVTNSSEVQQAAQSLADMAVQYLEGTAIEDIPAVVVPASATVVNRTTMEVLGLPWRPAPVPS